MRYVATLLVFLYYAPAIAMEHEYLIVAKNEGAETGRMTCDLYHRNTCDNSYTHYETIQVDAAHYHKNDSYVSIADGTNGIVRLDSIINFGCKPRIIDGTEGCTKSYYKAEGNSFQKRKSIVCTGNKLCCVMTPVLCLMSLGFLGLAGYALSS